ncbi:hypothetical protein TNCV_2204171 [Trichonephila clavipes]|nr:hypothetical protein TNCV_2204171 [Trichonephila clavipes]
MLERCGMEESTHREKRRPSKQISPTVRDLTIVSVREPNIHIRFNDRGMLYSASHVQVHKSTPELLYKSSFSRKL